MEEEKLVKYERAMELEELVTALEEYLKICSSCKNSTLQISSLLLKEFKQLTEKMYESSF